MNELNGGMNEMTLLPKMTQSVGAGKSLDVSGAAHSGLNHKKDFFDCNAAEINCREATVPVALFFV